MRIAALLLLAALGGGSAWGAQEPSPELRRALQRAQRCLQEGRAEQGLKVLRAFRRAHPAERCWLLELLWGNLCWKLGRREEALRAWQAATRLNPRDGRSWQNLARAYSEAGRHLEAARAFERAARLNGDRELRLYAAVAYLEAGRPREALVRLRALVGKARGAPERWLLALLRAQLAAHDLRGAEEVALELLRRRPLEARRWRWLARIRLRRGERLGAAVALEVARCLGDREATRELVDLYRVMGLHLRAARLAEELHGPSADARACERIAALWIAAHRPSRALRWLDRALRLQPTARRWLTKGEVLYRERRYREARDCFRRAEGLGAGPYASLLRGYCCWHLGDLRGAEAAFAHAARSRRYAQRAREALRALRAELQALRGERG